VAPIVSGPANGVCHQETMLLLERCRLTYYIGANQQRTKKDEENSILTRLCQKLVVLICIGRCTQIKILRDVCYNEHETYANYE
jgi:transcription initiation factor IIF auxiliary subunit